jgi:predicted signal transduction protein with EAL and GGDEF domain
LRHQSRHDALTGLPNRLFLEERLRQGIERAKQDPDYRLAVLFLDLDRFKQINDSLGHAAGDKLLVTVAERLRRCVRGGDLVTGTGNVEAADEDAGGAGHTVARLAGDEFTIVLDGLRTPDEAERVAARILRELDLPLEFGGQQIRAAASIGIVHAVGRCYTTAAQLLADADAALYKAKAGGRGRFVVFDADAQQSALERLRLASELRRAIEQGQFVLHYQPIVSLLDGQVAGFQVMPRWDHPERGLLLPDQFLDLAEETGLAEPLGDWVLQQGSRQLVDWKKRYPRHWPSQSLRALPAAPGDPGMFMIVALSKKRLADPALIHRVRALQQERQDALGDGWLRVTVAEPALMQDVDAVNVILAELRSAGVRIWIDNFGSGVTSLECMRSTALDGVKIDGRVVGSASGRRDYAAVLYSVLELARNLHLQVVADGLETAEQVMMLQAMGCNLGQGSYFGLPVAASEAEKMLEARSSAVPALSA